MPRLWTEIARRCGTQPDQNWNKLSCACSHYRGNKHSRRLILFSWKATVYWIWQERNNRLYRQQFRSYDSFLPLIDRQIRDKFRRIRLTSSNSSSNLCSSGYHALLCLLRLSITSSTRTLPETLFYYPVPSLLGSLSTRSIKERWLTMYDFHGLVRALSASNILLLFCYPY